MTKQSTLTSKCAESLLSNLKECGFSDSLTYRARAHAMNNQMVAEVISMMRATIAVHTQGGMAADTSANLRLRVNSIGKVRSKDAMNWQIDDLLNHLMGLVEVTEEVSTKQAMTEQATELAHSTIEGMTKRIVAIQTALETCAPGTMNDFVISRESKLVAYQWTDGVWGPSLDVMSAHGYSSIDAARDDAMACVRARGHKVVICQRREVVHTVLISSQAVIDQCSAFLGGEA